MKEGERRVRMRGEEAQRESELKSQSPGEGRGREERGLEPGGGEVNRSARSQSSFPANHSMTSDCTSC